MVVPSMATACQRESVATSCGDAEWNVHRPSTRRYPTLAAGRVWRSAGVRIDRWLGRDANDSQSPLTATAKPPGVEAAAQDLLGLWRGGTSWRTAPPRRRKVAVSLSRYLMSTRMPPGLALLQRQAEGLARCGRVWVRDPRSVPRSRLNQGVGRPTNSVTSPGTHPGAPMSSSVAEARRTVSPKRTSCL